jgi:hypothetical protein
MTEGQLARKIVDLTLNAEVAPSVIFSALQSAFVFWMSCLCADCRRRVAYKLEDDIDNMLKNAGLAATELGGAPLCH